MNKKLLKIAILAVSMLQMAFLGLSPVLAEIAKAFPDASDSTVQTIVTFPSIIVIVVTLVSGYLGSFISKGQLSKIGVFVLALAGVGGFLFHGSIIILYGWAACIGIGMGLFIPSVTVLIAENFEGAERGAVLGQQSTFVNGGGMLILFFGGLLATIGWNYNYLIYTILGIPILIIGMIGFPKGKPISAPKGAKVSIGTKPFYYAVIALMYTFTFSVLPTNAAMLVDETGIGNAATAGTASALMMLGGAVSGFIYGKVAPKLGDYMMSTAFVILSVGLLIVSVATNIPVLLIGSFIAGNGISFMIPQVIYSTSVCVKPQAATMAISVVMAVSGIGSFLSPLVVTPIAGLITDSVRMRFTVASGIGLTLALIVAITTTVLKKNKAVPNA